jgi:hypothetical protein
LQICSKFNKFCDYKVFSFLFIFGKAGKAIFLKKNRLRKPVKTQFEAVFGGFFTKFLRQFCSLDIFTPSTRISENSEKPLALDG